MSKCYKDIPCIERIKIIMQMDLICGSFAVKL